MCETWNVEYMYSKGSPSPKKGKFLCNTHLILKPLIALQKRILRRWWKRRTSHRRGGVDGQFPRNVQWSRHAPLKCKGPIVPSLFPLYSPLVFFFLAIFCLLLLLLDFSTVWTLHTGQKGPLNLDGMNWLRRSSHLLQPWNTWAATTYFLWFKKSG